MALVHPAPSAPTHDGIERSTGFNHSLDVMRGLAALCVVLHHSQASFQTGQLFSQAYLAVDFFFLLSGYVIGKAYDPRLAAGLSSFGFLHHRIARLWPIMAMGIALSAFVHFPRADNADVALIALVLQLCFIPFLAGSHAIFQLNSVQWSLWYELLANVWHAFLLRHLRMPWLLAMTAACGIGFVLFSLAWGTVGVGDVGTNWTGGFARAGFSYGLGYCISRQDATVRRWFGSWRPPEALAPFGLLFALMFASLCQAQQLAADLAIIFLIFPLLLLLAIAAPGGSGARTTSSLGAISYPLYAVHLPIIEWINRTAAPRSVDARMAVSIASILLAIALATVLAWIMARAATGQPLVRFGARRVLEPVG